MQTFKFSLQRLKVVASWDSIWRLKQPDQVNSWEAAKHKVGETEVKERWQKVQSVKAH